MATILVRFYLFWHGRMKFPGAGLLLRLFRGVLPGLRNYPLIFPGTGTARLDFRDQASFSLLNYKAGDWGNHRFLFETMATRLHPGEVLWDVGANVGLVSLHFSQGDQFEKFTGRPFYISSSRARSMTTDYPVPLEKSLKTLGAGSVSLQEGVRRTVVWLRQNLPRDFPDLPK